MSEHIHFDEAAVQSAIDELISETLTEESMEGEVGAAARMVNAVLSAMHMAVIREINRGTDVEHIGIGLANIIANATMTFATSSHKGDPEGDEIVRRINFVMETTGLFIERCISDGPSDDVKIIPMAEVGHA